MLSRPLTVGLVAHDAMKTTLVEWVTSNKKKLFRYRFFATGTTAKMLYRSHPDLDVASLKSGPLGGDQQLGAMISDGLLDALIFFQDPMTAQPHDVDVKALVRLSTLYNIALACNPSTADLLISSPLFSHLTEHRHDEREHKWASYLNRDTSIEMWGL